MSDISNSSCSSSYKRRLSKIDDDIEYLTQVANNLNDVVYKTEFKCSLLTLKMKREKVKALSAFARSQVLLTAMDIMIAEGDLNTDIEKLKTYKRLKLERKEGQSQTDAPQERNSMSVQTSESKSDKKKRKRSSSRTSDETVTTPTIHKNASFVETSQTSKTTLQSLDLFGISPNNKSDSEVSLSNSIKDEFNEPYTSTEQKMKTAKKNKSDKKTNAQQQQLIKKVESKNNSDRPKTVADLRKSTPPNIENSHMVSAVNNNRTGEKKTVPSSTYVPGRHIMPPVVNQYFTDMQNNKY